MNIDELTPRYAQSINANSINTQAGWIVMDREGALAVLHEILETFKESVIMNSVSLDNPLASSSEGFQIKINCILDSASRQFIAPILKKHNLFLKESEGFVVIQSIQ
jgi:hypothetical protein